MTTITTMNKITTENDGISRSENISFSLSSDKVKVWSCLISVRLSGATFGGSRNIWNIHRQYCMPSSHLPICFAIAIFWSRFEERYFWCSSAYFRGTGSRSLNEYGGVLYFSNSSILSFRLGNTSTGALCSRSGQRTSLKMNTPSRLTHPP